MQIVYVTFLFGCFVNSVSAFWCYHSLTKNLGLLDLYNGTAQLLHGTDTNPCVNGTITKNGITDNFSTTFETYKSILQLNFNKQVFPALPVSCPKYIPLKTGPNQKAITQFCTCNTNNCNMPSKPRTLNCQSQRKGFGYLRINDYYGGVEECADPNDTCVTVTGESMYSNISYKGCFGNLKNSLNYTIGMLPLPPKADGCTKLSFVGYFISAYCNVCQCSGQFCNFEWKNSEPITCVCENTGLALKGASSEALTTKMCAFNEPCSSISATVRSWNTGNSTNPPPAPLMTMQGCSMELNSAFAKGNFASYPDNSCYSYFADLGVAVDTDLVPTLCSCNTPNCTPVQTAA